MKKGGKRLDTGEAAKKSGRSSGGSRVDGAGLLSLWRGSRAFRIASIAVGVLVVLGVSAAVAWNSLARLPESDTEAGPLFGDETTDDPLYINPEEEPEVPLNGEAAVSSTPRPTPSPLKLRDDIYTVLLVGTFEDGNTDTIMVATLDRKAGRLDVMSIPRDTTVLRGGSMVKINSIYSRGGGGEKGMEALQQEMSALLGFKPNSFAMLKMAGFKKLVNTVGGVEFTIPFDMIHLDKESDKSINLKKGTYKLNGDEALQLMRFRVSDAGSGGGSYDDYGRMETQQRFIMAVLKKMVNLNNWTKITEYVKIASESIKPTNLDAGNMLGFAGEILKLESGNINFCTLPTKTSPGTRYYYENVVSEEALKLINETINPYTADITAEHVEWPQFTKEK